MLVETPSYLGALQAFSLFQPAFSAMQTDEQGIVTDALTAEQLAGARFMYSLPNFQNPTGRRCRWSAARRCWRKPSPPACR